MTVRIDNGEGATDRRYLLRLEKELVVRNHRTGIFPRISVRNINELLVEVTASMETTGWAYSLSIPRVHPGARHRSPYSTFINPVRVNPLGECQFLDFVQTVNEPVLVQMGHVYSI